MLYIHPHVQQVIDLHQDIIERKIPYPTVREQLTHFADNLFTAGAGSHPAFLHEIRNYHPTLAGKSDEEILGTSLTMEDFRAAIAREYGFAGWEAVERAGDRPFDADFEAAVDALVRGDFSRLRTLILSRPALLRNRSPYQHRAALIHYAGSNGVELWRQTVPSNLVEMTAWLIDRGADPHLDSNIYGGGTTLAELVASSVHPWRAGIGEALMQLLTP